jgi:hypothetical protein
MSADVDLYECVKLVLDAVDQLAAHAVRTSGSVESQKAEGLAHRARHILDALVATGSAKVG